MRRTSAVCLFAAVAVVLFLSSAADATQPQLLPNFDALIAALERGSIVRFTSNYGLCEGAASPPVQAVGGDEITTYEAFFDKRFGPQNFVSFSTSKLIENYQDPEGGWIYDFVRTRVVDNGTVTVDAKYLDAKSYETTMAETFDCIINDGSNKGGVSFFELGAAPSSRAVVSGSEACVDELTLFKTFIVGTFDNRKQIEQELDGDKEPSHPYAQHVSGVVTQRVTGMPPAFAENGFFVLEESYYTNVTTGVQTASPFLFFFSRTDQAHVEISAFEFPSSIPKDQLRNNNTALRLPFDDLVESKRFTPAEYKFDDSKQSFSVVSRTVIPPSTVFTLTETIAAERLDVLEAVEVNGHSVLPYSTPIVYDRL